MAHVMLQDKRATRGKRMSNLVGKAAEEDEEFYNNDIWKEGDESENDSYSEESEKPDLFDSDFNESEDSEDEEGGGSDDDERERPVKKTIYKDPKEQKKKKQPTNSSSTIVIDDNGESAMDVVESSGDAEKVKEKQKQPKAKKIKVSKDVIVIPSESRKVRESTKAKTAENIAKQQYEADTKPKIKREPKPKVTFDQDFLLKEALETEEENYRWLQRKKFNTQNAESAEAEIEKSKKLKKPPLKDFVRYYSSKDKGTLITFSSYEITPEYVKGPLPPPTVPQTKCVITGLPAKYRDPKTMLPYANLEAYKELQRRLANNEIYSEFATQHSKPSSSNGKVTQNSSSSNGQVASKLSSLSKARRSSFTKSVDSRRSIDSQENGSVVDITSSNGEIDHDGESEDGMIIIDDD